MEVISESRATAVINAAIETIDLTEWLFTLKSHEYQTCSSAHIAAGSSVSVNGNRMSINVEQDYIEEVGERDYCRVNSISDSFSPAGRTKLGVIWELKVEKLTDRSCEFINEVKVLLTDEFSSLLKAAGVTDLNLVKTIMEQNLSAHNQEETPLFAKDIEGKALSGIWV